MPPAKLIRLTSNILPGILLLLLSPFVFTKTLWNDTNLSFLQGNDYKVGDTNRNVFTIEHISGQSWGDTFFFLDRLKSSNGDDETYAEFSPRFSIGKLSDKKLEFGPITDILISSTWEIGEGFNNYLLGPAIDLKVPGFNFLQLNSYHRNNDSVDSSWQLTAVWAIPFSLSSWDFIYDGFADWESGNSEKHAHLNFTSQFKLDIGKFWSIPNKVFVGIEYVHWSNKFGIKNSPEFNTNERNVNALIKIHF